MSEPKLISDLKLFDVTNLVVGAIIGADIYVASSFGAAYFGPASVLIWIVAGIIAITIALCFAQCAALLPKVGGPYAYTKEAWGSMIGFIVGWSLWLAEWVSLAVFPVAFTRYLLFFFPDLDFITQIAVKCIFVTFLVITNIVGVKAAGKTNNILTLLKTIPLLLLAALGIIYMLMNPVGTITNYTPFLPFGFTNFGITLVLIFWAYAGFEISTIPADEIKDPGSTIPKAIITGISIVTIFYLVTNIVLFGVRPWNQLALDTAPLASAITTILSTNLILALIGGTIVSIGALISVAGSNESGMLGTSRLSYALAVDGYFPRIFAKIHPKYKTPYIAIAIQAATALIAAILGTLTILIATSVFFLAVVYIMTCVSIFSLNKKGLQPQYHIKGGKIAPVFGIAFSLYLLSQCDITQIITGSILLLIGIPIYTKFSPKKEMTELKKILLSKKSILHRAYIQEKRFLALILRHIKRTHRRMTGKKQTWET